MNPRLLLALLVIAFTALTTFSIPGHAKKPDLEQCLAIRENINKYSELRRNGGSAEDMEVWKRARSQHEQEFRALRCRKLGKAVR
ncbi:MAG: hypothetical protein AAGI24_01740 [Pseudomonadota bacterium]